MSYRVKWETSVNRYRDLHRGIAANKFVFFHVRMWRKKNTNYCYDVHRHVMPIILWHVSIPIVRVRHARLRKIGGCLKITEDRRIIALETFLCFSGTLLKSGSFSHARACSFSSHSLFLSLSHSLAISPTRYEPWKSHLFSWRGMIRSAQRIHGFTHLCVPARPPRTVRDAKREHKVYVREISLVDALMQRHTPGDC